MKHKILLFIGILISLIGYTREIQIKTISNNNVPISFVKVLSGGICLGFTDESGFLMIDNSSIVGKTVLLEKAIYHPKEVVLEDGRDVFIFDLEILDNLTVPDYSRDRIYSLIDQVLKDSKENSPDKQLEGLVSYLLESSLKTKLVVKEDIQMQFLVKPTKIKMLRKVEKSMKVWLNSILKAEPLRNRIYKSLYKKSDYTCSIESSYINEVADTILVVDIVKHIKNDEMIHTQIVINDSNKLILEFHNLSEGEKNGNAISEPAYHAIYSVKDGLLYPDCLSAKYIYQKNGEIDTRNIQVLFL